MVWLCSLKAKTTVSKTEFAGSNPVEATDKQSLMN